MQRRDVVLIAAATFIVALFTRDAAADCESELAKMRSIAATLTVSAELQSPTRVGAPVKITWQNNSPEHPEIPVYFIMTTPADVRFSGTGFIALTAGAKGLQAIGYGSDRARAFVPLHRDIDPAKGGAIFVSPYRPGVQTIGWAIVTIGLCGERVFGQGEKTIDVIPGSPEIVVQDRFADAKPVKRIRSLGGKHDLFVFDGRYEVYEVATGARIVDRPGINPNFSPTGRFIAAQESETENFEIIDLVTHDQIKSIEGAPGSLIWVRNDSYVIMGHWWYSVFIVRNIIVDNTKELVGGLGNCHTCKPWDIQFVLNLDAGFAVQAGGISDQAAVTDLVDFTEKTFAKSDSFQGATTYTDAARNFVRDVYKVSVVLAPHEPGRKAAPWDLGEPVLFSHYDDYERPKFEHRRVDHVIRSVDEAATGKLRGRALTGRGVLVPDLSLSLAHANRDDVLTRLASAGVTTNALLPVERATSEASVRAVLDELPINQMRPEARQVISQIRNEERGTQSWSGSGDAYRWRGKDGDRWLLEYKTKSGRMEDAQQSSSIYLLSTGLDPLKVIDDRRDGLTVPLKMHVSRLSERLVAVAALFRNRAVIVDANAHRPLGEFNLVDSALLVDMRLTADGGHLVQLNSDGRFFVYRIRDGRQVLIGAYVDDEIVTATDDGLYDATYEGAQAVQVHFPGYSGLFRFNQFETLLRRPGLAAAVLGEQAVAPPPTTVPAPPTAELRLTAIAATGRRTGTVLATTESQLAAVRVYVDGRLIEQIAAQGKRVEVPVSLADPGGGRWITAVAVDSQGLLSQPSSVLLPGKPTPRGTLRAVVVGVDSYEDSALRHLAYAKSDAERFARALKRSGGRAVRTVGVTQLLDTDVTPASVLTAVQRVAHETGPEDILVIFYAGHGIDGHARGQPNAGLVLTMPRTRMSQLKTTALSWGTVSQTLADVRGTVVFVLDACHSGVAGSDALATNDDVVSALITRVGAPIVVLAGSKGRQLSHESKQAGGGLFTAAIADAITNAHSRPDRNHRGIIDLGEFYSAVKSRVLRQTNGSQTPWLARNLLVGEMALF